MVGLMQDYPERQVSPTAGKNSEGITHPSGMIDGDGWFILDKLPMLYQKATWSLNRRGEKESFQTRLDAFLAQHGLIVETEGHSSVGQETALSVDIAVVRTILSLVFGDAGSQAAAAVSRDALCASTGNTRYQVMVQTLVDGQLGSGPGDADITTVDGKPSYHAVTHTLGELRRLLPLCPQIKCEQTRDAAQSIRSLVKAWLDKLLELLYSLIGKESKPSDAAYEAFADALLPFVVQFYTGGKQQRAFDALSSWYSRGETHGLKAPYFLEYLDEPRVADYYAALELPQTPDESRWRRALTSASKAIQVSVEYTAPGFLRAERLVLSGLRKDLAQIVHSSRYALKAAITKGMGGTALASGYLRVYQKLQVQLGLFSEAAFSARSKLEVALRGTVLGNYGSALDRIDAQFLTLLDELEGVQQNFLSQAERFYGDVCRASSETASQAPKEKPSLMDIDEDDGPATASTSTAAPNVIAQANAYLRELASSDVRLLRQVNWVHHTAYAFCHNEVRLFGYEMAKRNQQQQGRCFERQEHYGRDFSFNPDYHPQQVHLLTDDLIDSFPKALEGLKASKLLLHPDKSRLHPETAVVADYCWDMLDKLQAKAEWFNTKYRLGNWFNVKPREETHHLVPSRPYWDDVQPVEVVEEPKAVPFDLGIMRYHKRYVARIKAGQDLRKETQKCAEECALNTTGRYEPDSLSQILFESFLRNYRKQGVKRALRIIQRKLEEAEVQETIARGDIERESESALSAMRSALDARAREDAESRSAAYRVRSAADRARANTNATELNAVLTSAVSLALTFYFTPDRMHAINSNETSLSESIDAVVTQLTQRFSSRESTELRELVMTLLEDHAYSSLHEKLQAYKASQSGTGQSNRFFGQVPSETTTTASAASNASRMASGGG